MRTLRAASLALTLLLTAACSGEDTVDRLGAFEAVDRAVPQGWHEELCPGGGFTVRVAVPPPSNRWGAVSADGCSWRYQETALAVSFESRESLAEWRERVLDPYEDGGGDDSVERIRFSEDVPVFGKRRGDRLDWHSFSDGSPTEHRVLQAAGLRVHWSTPADQDKRHDELARVLDSVAVVTGEQHQCRRGEARLRYELPDRVESAESYAGRCRLVLRDTDAEERVGEVTVAPTRTLAQLATEVRDRPGVRSVRLERGAVELAGRRGDRLTWEIVRAKPAGHFRPAGTWRVEVVGDDRVRISWGATPDQWLQERDLVDRLIASVSVPGA